MQSALKSGVCRVRRWSTPALIAIVAAVASASAIDSVIWAQAPPAQQPATSPAQTPASQAQPPAPDPVPDPASPSATPATAPAAVPASLPISPSGSASMLNGTPVAIVPLDKSIPGAALSVSGPIQALNGRAFLTASGSITAGQETAQVTLPYRGTLRVCASSTVKLAADSSIPANEAPPLLIAMDHGAVEMSFAASAAREKNADTLLTPYFRVLIGGPDAADIKVRLGANGDTCVDNSGGGSPYVVVTSVFDGGLYRVQPGQRVMFERGSLSTVNDQEKEPCGCPPPPKPAVNEFPLAQSEGLTAPASAAPVASSATAPEPGATDTFSYNGTEHATQPAGPVTVAPPGPAEAQPVSTTPASTVPSEQKKRGFFKRVGAFFRKAFGAE